ncbi:MAG: hypothetical protein Q8P24_19425 [Desulfobacterales bacterium]|nr:hypothetical protein [Desulfobacterales bacterium]
MEKTRRHRAIGVLVFLTVLLLLMAGCSRLKPRNDPGSAGLVQKERGSVYYDFGDIPVPRELKMDKGLSFVFRAPGFSAGVLSLYGRVEVNSLINFFDQHMARDNWRPVSSFKSPRTIMLFNKENRWCVINISEKSYYTHVDIWVSPASGGEAPGLTK